MVKEDEIVKKIFVTIIAFIICITSVSANNDYYYINKQGVTFTKEQYDFFSEMYYDGYQDYMTQYDFDFIDKQLMNKNLVKTEYSILINPFSTQIVTASNTLKISKTSDSNISYIVTTLVWNSEPTIKSYDVIVAYLDGCSLIGSVNTKLVSNLKNESYSINNSSNNAFGTSVLLSGYNIKVTQSFKVTNVGKVYASYQHAKSKISLSDSKKYTFSKTGYGNVFKFSGIAVDIYDKMSGVNISI